MCVDLQTLLKNASYISRSIEKEFAIVLVVISSQNLSSAGKIHNPRSFMFSRLSKCPLPIS